ncbi:hypothetical protein QBC44DRAFT_102146 [Cladorrhinum sp. PSN332]|nr:hypothetical protein QBC44DRAFT_102146 [Cladorrhinum sp. PSN332]
MGGFAIDTRYFHPEFIPGSPVIQTLSPDGLVLLARCRPDLIPDISEADILDKSKADGLKKFLICIQATWFLVSTIFRLASGLPIALLELTTFVHALCALLTYAIWWSKPLDIKGATLIDGRLCEDVVAFFALCSHYHGRRELDLLRYQPEKSSPPRVRFFPNQTSSADGRDMEDEEIHSTLRVPEHDPQEACDRALELPSSYFVFQMQQMLYGFRFEITHGWSKLQRSPHSVRRRPYILLKAGDLLRWRRASEAARGFFLHHQEDGQSFVNLVADGASDPQLDPDLVSDLLVNRAHNWLTDILSLSKVRTRDLPTLLTLMVANAFYGVLHLLPLIKGKQFYTKEERFLWLFSSASLCGISAFVYNAIANNLIFKLNSWFMLTFMPLLDVVPGDFEEDFRRGMGFWKSIGSFIFPVWNLLVIWGVAAILLFARVYLVVECFLDLFRLDPKVFVVPSWVNYFPHIG